MKVSKHKEVSFNSISFDKSVVRSRVEECGTERCCQKVDRMGFFLFAQ